ncbi:MAG TPA: diguanylate cyclase [Acetobacteraceae bacterium]|nr:diguanylate cyclase [Acetobacteraceae bacterium]
MHLPRRLHSGLAYAPAPGLSLQGGMFLLVACACLTLIASEGLQLWRVHRSNIEQANIVSANTARSLAEQADATIKTADTIAATLVQRVEADGVTPEARSRFYGLMTSLAAALPAIHEMGITDNRGNAIVKALVPDPKGLNYAERRYFRYHATHRDTTAFIGDSVQSKIDHTYNITVSHRINQPDGSFGGVVVASVSLQHFQDLFDQIQAKSGGIIALVADDQTVIVRSPPLKGQISAPASKFWHSLPQQSQTGTITFRSDFDGVMRQGSFHRLAHYPLTVLVAQSVWDVQSGWRSELLSHGIILGCFLLAMIVVVSQALRASRLLNLQATHDPLTGLANRRSFDEAIAHEFRRHTRARQPFSVVMIDVDKFKAYNDQYGHPAGDACLRAVAHAIESCVRRAGELPARYGGEEFAVILPGYDTQQAVTLAETMRLAVSDLAIPHAGSFYGTVTLSLGVATWMKGCRADDWSDLIQQADTALYAAKSAGRDRVMTHAFPAAQHSGRSLVAVTTSGH